MKSYPVPNHKGVEHEPFVSSVTTRQMTVEERERLDKIRPQKNPLPTIQRKRTEPVEPTKQEEPMEDKKPGKELTFPHVNKEFIEAAFASGKTAGQIERENGMQQGTIYARLKRFGIENQNQRKKPEQAETAQERVEAAAKICESIQAVTEGLEEPLKELADMINHPPHYKTGGIETIDFIRAKLTDDEFAGFCKGNVIKYLSREKLKGGIESLRKAKWYLDRLLNDQ